MKSCIRLHDHPNSCAHALAVLFLPRPEIGPSCAPRAERHNNLRHELIAPCCWREAIAIDRSEEAMQTPNVLQELLCLLAVEGKEDQGRSRRPSRRLNPCISSGKGRPAAYVVPFALL